MRVTTPPPSVLVGSAFGPPLADSAVHFKAPSRLLHCAVDAWRRIDAFIHDRLADPLGIDDLATQVHLSRHHFLRQFRRATGLTPGQYLIERRLSHARAQLRDTRWPVAEVAARCGSSSEAHFAHSFRKRYGQTPTAYRQAVGVMR